MKLTYHHMSIFRKLDLKLGNQLQFKCDLEQKTLWNLILASRVNLWKYKETVQHNMENHLIFACRDRTLQYSGNDMVIPIEYKYIKFYQNVSMTQKTHT
jgi:hypothetical protein